MLSSPRRIMRKDLQLKLNIDTREGRNVKARQNFAISPRVLAMIALFFKLIYKFECKSQWPFYNTRKTNRRHCYWTNKSSTEKGTDTIFDVDVV